MEVEQCSMSIFPPENSVGLISICHTNCFRRLMVILQCKRKISSIRHTYYMALATQGTFFQKLFSRLGITRSSNKRRLSFIGNHHHIAKRCRLPILKAKLNLSHEFFREDRLYPGGCQCGLMACLVRLPPAMPVEAPNLLQFH